MEGKRWGGGKGGHEEILQEKGKKVSKSNERMIHS